MANANPILPQTQQESQARGGSGRPAFPMAAIAVIVIVVVAALAYLYLAPSQSVTVPTTTSTLPTTTAQPVNLGTVLAGPNPNVTSVAGQMQSLYYNSSGLWANYTGGAVIYASAANNSVVKFTFPARASIQNYLGSTRILLGFNGIPKVGIYNSISIVLSNASYTCNSYTYVADNSPRVPIIGTKYACSSGPASTLLNAVTAMPSKVLFASQVNSGSLLSSQITYVDQRAYYSQNCYMAAASGSASGPANVPTIFGINLTGSFRYLVSSCISGKYGIPLNLTANLTGFSSGQRIKAIVITLNESSTGQGATASSVSTLPGPIGASPGNATIPAGNSSNMPPPPPGSYSNGKFACSGAFANGMTFSNCINFSISANAKVNATISLQNSTMIGVQFGCAISSYNGLSTLATPTYYGIFSNGEISSANASGSITLVKGEPFTIMALPCTWGNMAPASISAGVPVSGTVWYKYSNTSRSSTGIIATFSTIATK